MILMRGGAAAARVAHNHEAEGSSPSPATSFARQRSLAEYGMVATPRESRRREASCSFLSRETLARFLRLAAPARERGVDHLAGSSTVLGAAPIRNRLREVSENKPAILFSVRRRILAKGNDGADLRVHERRPLPVARSVAGSVFRMFKRKLVADQVVSEARAWAKELTALEITGPGDLERAWERLEGRYGIPYSTFWSLRYDKGLKDVWGSIHIMLERALEHERELRSNNKAHRKAVDDLTTRSPNV